MGKKHGLLKFMDCFYGPTPFYLATLANNLGGRVSLRNIHVLAALPRGNFFLVLCYQLKPSVLPSITLDMCIVALKSGIDGQALY